MPLKPTDRFTYSRNGGGNRDERCLIRVNIPSVESDAEHTRYKIDVTNVQTRQTWQTSHRYSEFLALRNELLGHFGKAERKCPGCVNFEKVIRLFEFPTKRYFTSKNTVVINYRKTALRAFLELLTSHTFTTSPKCPTCSGLPFTAVRDFLTDEPTPSNASGSPTNSLNGDLDARESVSVRDTIQAKNFTTYVAPAKSAPVSSDGVFVRQTSKKGSNRSNSKQPPSAMKSQSKKQAKVPPQEKRQQQAPPPAAQDLPASPASSKSSVGLPASPTRVDTEQARRDEAASFVSFSGASESKEPAPTQSSPRRRAGTPKNRRNKNKRGSSRPSLESESSVKESQDDEFGSLNLDFLQSVSVAKQ